MSRKTEIVTAVGTLGCALGVGFMMQSGEVAELRYGTTTSISHPSMEFVGKIVTMTAPDLEVETLNLEPFTVEGIKLTSALVPALPVLARPDTLTNVVADPDVFDLYLKPNQVEGSLLAPELEKMPDCAIAATATPQAAAMMAYTLSAPCFAGQTVVISHEDLMFSEVLSEDGTLKTDIPALAEEATIRAFFETGETIETDVQADSLALYDRVLVQWRGTAGVQIHAREFGADYGDEGHVWSGARRDLSAVSAGHGGYLTTLGDPTRESAHVAEVYTYPTALTKMSGAVDLTVETEVTAGNCDREIQAQAMQFSGGKEVSSQVMTLAMPDCDAIGSFLVLNNLLQDLTVASK